MITRFLFNPPTSHTYRRENKRMLDKSIRELDRERNNLQSQEKKLIADIKKMAKQNQMGAVKVSFCFVLFLFVLPRGE